MSAAPPGLEARRRPFGAGPAVSLFTLGTMRALATPAQMLDVLEAAVHAGINHLETAPAYGPAESFLGPALQALKQRDIHPDGGWVITSKVLPGVTLEEGQRQLMACMKRLGVSHLDNWAIHGLNRDEHLHWALEGDGQALMRWAQSEGLVGQVGFSSHGSNELIDTAIRSGVFRFCSLHLHLLDPRRMPLATLALQNGLGVMAISPADKGGRLQDPSLTLINDCSPIPPLALAYRFLLSAGISTLTLGANQATDLQLARQLASADQPLHTSEQQAIGQLRARRSERLGLTECGQCQACLPCPNAVPIPELLRLRNLRLGHDLQGYCEERYNLIGRAGHWWESHDASACADCRACLPRCPHQLPIPTLLAETHALLSAPPRRRLWG
ncbi:MAG: aldo/keto reductase [Synechococcus sp.]